VEIAPLRRFAYRGPDGLQLETFAIFPPGYRPDRPWPLTLQIHGGPHGFHPTGFQLSYQALAAAGYVVLLPNPRGSATYGESFASGCVEDWGGKHYEDLMAAVDLLVRRGIADPERLTVGGYSYGGFMTSWAVGHTDRFRAAIVGAPVTDHVSMFGTTDIPWFSIYEHGGTPWEIPDTLRLRSPVTYLPNVKTPVLLVHWEGDLRCPVSQSEEVFQGLKMLGKRVEFVRYPGGSHGVRTPSQAVDEMKRRHAWYARYTAAGRPKAALAARRTAAASRNGARPARVPAAARVKAAART
jgi:dipeptidyl aminopeptidase/acylaminoacyl peptidase